MIFCFASSLSHLTNTSLVHSFYGNATSTQVQIAIFMAFIPHHCLHRQEAGTADKRFIAMCSMGICR